LDYRQTIEWLQQRLQQPLPGFSAQENMIGRVVPMPHTVPHNARQSAVLILLFPVADVPHILLMKRKEDSGAHSGQVSFPGGSADPTDKDMMFTALREAEEEVGVTANDITIIGGLTNLYIPVSNFNVHPYIGYMDTNPEYILSHNEVAHVIEVPVHYFLNDDYKTLTDVVSPAVPGVIRQVRAYKLKDGTIIWGATAMILAELEAILKERFA